MAGSMAVGPARIRIGPGLLACLLFFLAPARADAEPWPAWRGPHANGTSSETGFPVSWSVEPEQEQNLLWKQSLRGSRGGSSPVVWGDHLFITTQVGHGPVEGEFAVEGQGSSGLIINEGQFDLALFVLALRTADGAVAWAVEVPPGRHLVPIGRAYDFASPSCVTDGERVYAWFGTGPVACFDMNGRGLWQRRIEEEFAPFDVRWGHGSSPMLHGDLLVLLCDHAPGSYVLALNKFSGETVWKLDLGRPGRSYSTPVAAGFGGRDQLLVNWPHEIGAIDPAEGKMLWTVKGLDYMMVPMPVVDEGVIYTAGGQRSGPMMAVRPRPDGSAGDEDILWRHASGGPYIASPIKVGAELYTAGETGVIKCYDAATGARLWQGRGGASYFASPVASGETIYMVDEMGDTVVFKAGREFDVIARNRIGERTVASPALADGRIYIRTDRSVYCIGDAP